MRTFQGMLATTLTILIVVSASYAQHPLEVQRLSANGEHLRAMAAFHQLPERKVTTAATTAMGNSAWALGLNESAAQAFDRALRDPKLGAEQRARLMLSRGLIELQNRSFQVATLFAERAFKELSSPSPLRGQVLALWGEALMRQSDFGSACSRLSQAREESAEAERSDINVSLGTCQQRLGDLEEARISFEQVPLQHDKAAFAVRALATIALDAQRYAQAEFWLGKGRELFPQDFLDGWVDYASMTILTAEGREGEVRDLLKGASERYPESDGWYQLLRAQGEMFLWRFTRGEQSRSTDDRGQAVDAPKGPL